MLRSHPVELCLITTHSLNYFIMFVNTSFIGFYDIEIKF